MRHSTYAYIDRYGNYEEGLMLQKRETPESVLAFLMEHETAQHECWFVFDGDRIVYAVYWDNYEKKSTDDQALIRRLKSEINQNIDDEECF